LLAGLVLALSCVTASSRAEAASGADIQSVQIVLVGDLGAEPTLAQRVTSWFDAERFRVAVATVARLDSSRILSPPGDRAVHVWAVLRDPLHARLFFVSVPGGGGAPTYLWRDLELEGGLDEMGAERVAQVIHLSTLALLEGQAANRREEVQRALDTEPAARRAAAPDEPEAAPDEPKATPDPERGSRVHGELTLGYGVSLRGQEGLWQGPRAGLGVRAPRGWGLRVQGQAALPQTQPAGPVELSLTGGDVELALSVRTQLGSRIWLEGIAGPCFEVVAYRPERSLDPSVVAEGGATEVRPGVMAGVAGVLRDSAPHIAAGARGTVSLLRTHYDVVTGEGRRVVARSSPVVPSFFIELRL